MLLFQFWKKLSSGSRSLCMTLILYGLEKILEIEFKCPTTPHYAMYYMLSFFMFPGLVVSFISVYLLAPTCGRTIRLVCSLKLFEGIAPLFTWIGVLLIDGRYLECLLRTTNSTKTPSDIKTISQISGLAGFFLLVSFYLAIQCCCSRPEDREIAEDEAIELNIWNDATPERNKRSSQDTSAANRI